MVEVGSSRHPDQGRKSLLPRAGSLHRKETRARIGEWLAGLRDLLEFSCWEPLSVALRPPSCRLASGPFMKREPSLLLEGLFAPQAFPPSLRDRSHAFRQPAPAGKAGRFSSLRGPLAREEKGGKYLWGLGREPPAYDPAPAGFFGHVPIQAERGIPGCGGHTEGASHTSRTASSPPLRPYGLRGGERKAPQEHIPSRRR